MKSFIRSPLSPLLKPPSFALPPPPTHWIPSAVVSRCSTFFMFFQICVSKYYSNRPDLNWQITFVKKGPRSLRKSASTKEPRTALLASSPTKVLARSTKVFFQNKIRNNYFQNDVQSVLQVVDFDRLCVAKQSLHTIALFNCLQNRFHGQRPSYRRCRYGSRALRHLQEGFWPQVSAFFCVYLLPNRPFVG